MKLPLLKNSVPSDSTIYGGRTLMNNTGNGCSRMKFIRKDEPVEEFFREEAVQRFAHKHADTLCLKSEIPKPVGVKFVPIRLMPEKILDGFRSELETIQIKDQSFYLVYEFTTNNQDYSTLAHKKDDAGDSSKAKQGLLKACHDLGVWSSLGAVHTSTIQAYHSFANHRRELFLSYMFTRKVHFPGSISGWDGQATDGSDWGYTSLRDIGDLEFYPHIKSIFKASDIGGPVPVGFDQRSAFLNAFCENMVAAVLHYARLHRDDPDYHYKNPEGRKKLEAFIDQAFSAY